VRTNRTKHHLLGIAAFRVKGMAAVFRREGLDVGPLFHAAGVELTDLEDPDRRYPSETINRLWRLAVARSGNPAIGLAAARVAMPALFDVVGYAMMSAPDLLGLLQRLERYFRIISTDADFSVTAEQDGYRARLRLSGGDPEVAWQRYAFTLLSTLSFIRWIMQRDTRPLAVELTTTAGAEARPYQEAFECPLHFGAPSNALVFSRADVGLPLPTAQPRLANVHERVVSEYLARLDHSRTSVRVRAAIPAHLPDGEPRRAAVARALGMSERTLQRRLEAEGASFRLILDDTRQELARKYFEQGNVSLAHMAWLLGFNDQSSFFRATRRWFGMTPRQYRLRHGPSRAA
jgi:AraC-like DNA-binding protein